MAFSLPDLVAKLRLDFSGFNAAKVKAQLATINAAVKASSKALDGLTPDFNKSGSLAAEAFVDGFTEGIGRDLGEIVSGLGDFSSFIKDSRSSGGLAASALSEGFKEKLDISVPDFSPVGKKVGEDLEKGVKNQQSSFQKTMADLIKADELEAKGLQLGEEFGHGFQRPLTILANNVRQSGREIGDNLGSEVENSARRFNFSNVATDVGTKLQGSLRNVLARISSGGSGDGGDAGGGKIGRRFGDAFERNLRESTDRTERRLSTFGRGITLTGLIAGVAALSQQFLALVSAIAPAAAALASLPAFAGVALAGISTLITGFSGIGAALKTSTKAAGAAAIDTTSQQRALENAVKGVGKAERDVEEATRDVSKAYRDADSAARDVVNANRDVEQTTKGVASAQRDLEAAERAVADAQRGVVAANQDVTRALRSVSDAQKQSLAAEKALTDARKEAVETLEDYNLRLLEASADQESAALAVLEARQRLADLSKKSSGDDVGFTIDGTAFDKAGNAIETFADKAGASALQYRRAQLDITQAELRYQQVVKQTSDLQKEAADATAAGVEGNQSVIDAKDAVADATVNAEEANIRLADSLQGVNDANQRVADSQQSVLDATDGVAEANYRVQESLQGVIDAGYKLADANQGIKDAQQSLIDAQDGVIEAHQSVTDAQHALAKAGAAVGSAQDKAAEAFNKLSPAAQRLVKVILGLRDEWDALRKTVQESLFAGIDKEVSDLATTSLPTLTKGMTAVAGAFNAVFKSASAALQTPLFQGALATIFEATATAITTLNKATGPLITGFANLAVAGIPLMQRFTTFVADLLASLGAYLSSARGAREMGDAMQHAGDVLSTLYNILKNVGGIIGSVFQAAEILGFLEAIEKATDKFNDFLKTAQGKSDLDAVFTTLEKVTLSLAKALGVIVRAVVEVLKAFNDLSPQVQNIILGFIGFSIVIGPVLSALAGLSVSISGIADLMKTLSTVFALAVTPVGLVVLALLALGIGLGIAYVKVDEFHDGVNDAFAAIRDFVKPAIEEVIEFAKQKFQEIKDFGDDIWPDVQEAVEHTLNAIQFIWHRVGDDILSATERIWTAIKSIIDAQLQIIMGIIRLVLAIINGDWSKAFDALKQITQGVFDAMFATVKLGVGLIQSVLGAFASLLGGLLDAGWEKLKGAASGAFQYVKDHLGTFIRDFTSLQLNIPSNLFDPIKNAFKAAINYVIDKWNGLEFKIGGQKVFGQDLPGVTISTPDISRFAAGGVANGLAVVGELGPEIINVGSQSRVNTNHDFVTSLVSALREVGINGNSNGSGNSYTIVNETVPFTPQQMLNESMSALKQMEMVYGV